MKKTKFMFIALFLILASPIFSNQTATASYLEGCNAYAKGDWDSAVFLLERAITYTEYDNPDTAYMLITAKIYSGDENEALKDCENFLLNYPNSIYEERVQYTRGKILYNLGEYEQAIVVLSDFCHRSEDKGLYPSALFYIAESLFAAYKYDEAEKFYEQIITDYPDSDKTSAAQYRMETISQRSREEKLLYLLKQTGEEYLAAKEDYERQLKLYNSDAINTTREKLVEAQMKNKSLEEQIADLERQIASLENEKRTQAEAEAKLLEQKKKEEERVNKEKEESLKEIKQKAIEIQKLLDQNK